MKKRILHIFMFVFFMFIVLDGYSQSVSKRIKENALTAFNKKSNSRENPFRKKEKGNITTGKQKSDVLKSSLQEVTFTIELDYEDEEYDFDPSAIIIYNEEYGIELDEWELDEISMPAGEYDILVSFQNWDNYGIYLVVKEQVQIEDDMSISISVSEAKNHIALDMYSPEGELFLVPVLKDNSYDGGNIQDMWCYRLLILKGYGPVDIYGGNWGYREEEENTRNEFDYYISDVSERYLLTQSRITMADDGYYVNKFMVNGANRDMVITNNPEDYVLYEPYFQRSPASKEAFADTYSAFYADFIWKGAILDELEDYNVLKTQEGKPVKVYLDNTLSQLTDEDGLDILFYPAYIEKLTSTGGWLTVIDPVLGLPVALDADRKVRLINNGHSKYGNYAFQITPEGDYYYFPGHPAFSYTVEEGQKINNGNNVPVTSVNAQGVYNVGTDSKISWIDFAYIGRYGEIRMFDYSELDISIQYNGEEVFNGEYDELEDFTVKWALGQHPDGVFDLAVINSNIEVDGIPGKNSTYISYDQRNEDWTAPTLQMLHFRNTDGIITDRFKTASEGVIEFAGADFNFRDIAQWYFDTKEMNVNVYYSPWTEENWIEMEVEEIPDLFRYTAFGYFYRGALESVNLPSPNKWYDLKIVCEDTSGNTQTQILSPAFRINEVETGIDNKKATVAGQVYVKDKILYINGTFIFAEVYSVSGQHIKTINGNAGSVNMQDIASGVYIVKIYGGNSHTSHKVIID